jgi:4-phospho-D-threonate 3-dehydrogenase / 4-phospho-D-erythronate 3-dehydrogenase
MGDINGVGPEILAKALANQEMRHLCQPLVVGSADALAASAQHDGASAPFMAVPNVPEAPWPEDRIPVCGAGAQTPPRRPGRLDAEAGRCAVQWLQHAVRLAMAGTVDAIVTCPLNKEGIALAGYHYPGHTEIIAEMTESPDYRMCLFAGHLRIVHITSHHALSEAIHWVTKDRIAKSIRLADDTLKRLGLARRRIAVAGLNPHAGEAGLFGSEEQREIAPAVEACQQEGIDCSGPHPPDTVFRKMNAREVDIVVAMYHDQGHIPLKLIAMDEGVNVTLGIPIIRTSVDHGTAYDIAGTGQAREASLCAAITLAAQLAADRPAN